MSSETADRPPFPTKAEIYRKSGTIALVVVSLALCISIGLDPAFGAVALFAVLPGFAIFCVAWLARLRLVGFLTTNAEELIPIAIRTKLVPWGLFRLGIFAGVLLLIAAAIVAGFSGFDIQPFVEAFVYVVMLQVLGNLLVGTVVNVGLIVGRRAADRD